MYIIGIDPGISSTHFLTMENVDVIEMPQWPKGKK